MALSNNQITALNFKDFFNQIRPYLNGEAHDVFLPVGAIIPMMGNTAPLNTLVCDGTVYNIADYPQLASYFVSEFGSVDYFGGDGETTFAVPDLRGEFIRGAGTNSHTNQGSGGDVGEHQDATQHSKLTTVSASEFGVFSVSKTSGGVTAKNTDTVLNSTNNLRKVTSTNTSVGGYEYYTSRPTNTSVLYVIVYKNVYADIQDLFTAGDGIVIENNEISTNNMSSEDMSEVASPMPSVMSRIPVLFDETGEERVVGWYKLANGTKKPLYEKTLIINLPATSAKTTLDVELISSTDAANMELIYGYGRYIRSDGYIMLLPLAVTSTDNGSVYMSARIQQYTDKSIKIQYRTYAAQSNTAIVYATVQYIKTTD